MLVESDVIPTNTPSRQGRNVGKKQRIPTIPRPVRDGMLVESDAIPTIPRPVRDGMLVKNDIIPTIPRPVRDGMCLLFNRFKNIFFIIFYSKRFQKINVFCNKILFFMMFGLVAYVFYYVIQLRF